MVFGGEERKEEVEIWEAAPYVRNLRLKFLVRTFEKCC